MKGAIEACCKAEADIMKKLREAYDNDIAAINVGRVHGDLLGRVCNVPLPALCCREML